MHVVLINTTRFRESSQRVVPPIGLYYLASYAEYYAPDVRVTVCRTPGELFETEPDIIGIAAVTENADMAIRWAKKFREKYDVPIIIGGNHISALPRWLPGVFDAGVIGEGEETFVELIKLIDKDSDWRRKLDRVAGICYHDGEDVAVNPARPLIEPIERIPFPRREKEIWGGFQYCFTARGCPYNCTFCSPRVMWNHYRTFSAIYVVRELDEIFACFRPYFVQFADDLFTGDRERVRKISEMVVKRGYNKRVSFGGHVRADVMDDDMCRNLRLMNFMLGSFGAESGSDRILKILKAGSSTVEMNQQAINMCRKYGIEYNLSFILGTPGETAEDLDMTMEFIKKNRDAMTGIEIYILRPFPGTPMWNYCKKRGLVSEDMDWNLFESKAYFSKMEITDDFLYVNHAMPRDQFRKYVDKFQKIDAEINVKNSTLFEFIESTVPNPVKFTEEDFI